MRPDGQLESALWRALAVFRTASLGYAVVSFGAHRQAYARPGLAVAVLVAMAAWTGLVSWRYGRPGRSGRVLLAADLALTVGALLTSLVVLRRADIVAGDPTLTVSWAAAPVLAWALRGGPLPGVLAAVVVGTADVVERRDLTQATANGIVLLLLAGSVIGYVVQLARRAELALAAAVELRAAATERERLARQIHDGVLQALALVSRRSTDHELVALAAREEAALRRLVARPLVLDSSTAGKADLRALLPAGAQVEVSAPADPVLLPSRVAGEMAAAVGAAVANALAHGGGRAWLLVEDEPHAVTVSVRDDGPGIPAGRLEQAEQEGRMGVARSIRGRIGELGGTVDVVSRPGQGTEVELRVPRS